MGRLFGFLMLVLLVIIGLSFAVLNAEPVDLHYYFGDRQIPLSLIVVAALTVGAVFGMLAMTGIVLRLKRQLSTLKKRVRYLEKDTEPKTTVITRADSNGLVQQ